MEYTIQHNSDLSEAAKQARREYRREWNRKNRDKVRAAQKRFWERKALKTEEAPADEQKTDQI